MRIGRARRSDRRKTKLKRKRRWARKSPEGPRSGSTTKRHQKKWERKGTVTLETATMVRGNWGDINGRRDKRDTEKGKDKIKETLLEAPV